MASSMKRAPTSAMRPAPLVITMKLISTRMMKTITPTAKLPPTRKWPKASITLPAASGPVWPCISTTRVEATLSDSRSSVENSSTAGKAAKSSAFMVYMLTSSTITDSAMLKVNSRSSRKAGSGSTIMLRIMMMRIGPASPLNWLPEKNCVGRRIRLVIAFIRRSRCIEVRQEPATSVGMRGASPPSAFQRLSW